MWALISGLPPESATWRQDDLPPLERMADSHSALMYDLIDTLVAAVQGHTVRMPPRPDRLVAPQALAPTRPRNVVSIAEFARQNQKNLRKEVS